MPTWLPAKDLARSGKIHRVRTRTTCATRVTRVTQATARRRQASCFDPGVTRPVTPRTSATVSREPDAYWALAPDALLQRLDTTPDGLSSAEAARRLHDVGPNQIHPRARLTRLRVLINQLRNPLLLVLVFAAAASALTGEWVDAHIVLAIVFASVGVGYAREYRAEAAAADLQARIRSRARALRDGRDLTCRWRRSSPATSSSSPPAASCRGWRILDATDCFISEAVLTGESFPVEKQAGRAGRRPAAPRAARTACFLGPTCGAERRASSS